jgi:hypothetical protein
MTIRPNFVYLLFAICSVFLSFLLMDLDEVRFQGVRVGSVAWGTSTSCSTLDLRYIP